MDRGGAQSVAHKRTDVQALDADFVVFSGHKMFAPTGIGAVYGKLAILDTTPLARRGQHDRRRDIGEDDLPERSGAL
jgi:selenocysteine lyase/cysteine desulfurase